jgi:hypothetical protein
LFPEAFRKPRPPRNTAKDISAEKMVREGHLDTGPAHLAVALACEGVTHTRRGACFVAVTGAAAGVTVEAWSTGVTAAPSHVGSAPASGQRLLEPLSPMGHQQKQEPKTIQRSHLHWPLSMSQVGSVSSCTPGPEQLHSSHPTKGWQPKVWGWQTRQSGGMVRGGQMHWPVSSSHRRAPQSQAVRADITSDSSTPLSPNCGP